LTYLAINEKENNEIKELKNQLEKSNNYINELKEKTRLLEKINMLNKKGRTTNGSNEPTIIVEETLVVDPSTTSKDAVTDPSTTPKDVVVDPSTTPKDAVVEDPVITPKKLAVEQVVNPNLTIDDFVDAPDKTFDEFVDAPSKAISINEFVDAPDRTMEEFVDTKNSPDVEVQNRDTQLNDLDDFKKENQQLVEELEKMRDTIAMNYRENYNISRKNRYFIQL